MKTRFKQINGIKNIEIIPDSDLERVALEEFMKRELGERYTHILQFEYLNNQLNLRFLPILDANNLLVEGFRIIPVNSYNGGYFGKYIEGSNNHIFYVNPNQGIWYIVIDDHTGEFYVESAIEQGKLEARNIYILREIFKQKAKQYA
jgi:hypothetical protein